MNKQRHEGGFTIVETLMAIALTIICAGAVSVVVFVSFRSLIKEKSLMEKQYKMLRIDMTIREAVESVCVPYWDRSETGMEAARTAIEKSLSGTRGFITALEAIRDTDGSIRGITCRFQSREEDLELESRGLFASIPVIGDTH